MRMSLRYTIINIFKYSQSILLIKACYIAEVLVNLKDIIRYLYNLN